MKFRFIAIIVFSLLLVQVGQVIAGKDCCVSTEINEPDLVYDDLAGAGLEKAISASLRFMKKLPQAREYRLCDQEFTVAELAEGLAEFLELYTKKGSSADFVDKVKKHFDICGAASPKGDGKLLVTGYFEPVLEGSMERKPPFIYPLYRVPDDLIEKNGSVGRIQDGQLIPYWKRAKIE